jgi:YVTN family beta-propeller protein
VKPPIDPDASPLINPLLPDGHSLTPAGISVPVGALPLGMSLSPDKRNIVVVNSGIGNQTLSLLNIQKRSVVQTLLIRKSWMGSVWGPYNDYFFVTAGNDNKVYRYGFANDSAWFLSSIILGKPAPEEYVSPAGVDINSEGKTIYTVSKMSNTLFRLNAFDNRIERALKFDHPLYTCVLDETRRMVFVSIWGGAKIAVVHADSLSTILEIPVGRQPTAMALNPSKTHLFVANSGENSVSVINTATLKTEATIDVAVTPASLTGSMPNALAFSGDTLLFVSLGGNNALAVVDVRNPAGCTVRGFIPTGWHPSAVAVADSVIVVANSKGERSFPNPDQRSSVELIKGSVSFIPIPNGDQLHAYTRQVFENNPYTRKRDYSDWLPENPVPVSAETKSPIKHIFYIVKELRSYDQVFGDIRAGDGEDSLAVYGRSVTPNHHALAEEFVLMDNFYANGQVTADGMQHAVSGHANDYTARTWPTLYGRRGGDNDYERDGMATSGGGYLWDQALKHGIRVRNYGLFVDETASARGEIIPMVSGLAAVTSPIYRGWDLYYYDTLRAEMWMKEFNNYERGDSLPQLSLIRLPNDNTAGESRNHRSRASYMADNDRALGKIVERISASKYWKESVIFVLETSAYGGADHKDAQRTIGLVISPYVKRSMVDHTHYTTTSVVHTIERILGLPFMTQHDAGAMPMYRMFQSQVNLKPFQSLPISNSVNEFAQ